MMDSTRLQITSHGVDSSPALIQRIADLAGKLDRVFNGITFCHVVITHAHKKHIHADPFNVRIELGVPRTRIIVQHEPPAKRILKGADAGCASKALEVEQQEKDPYFAVREAFDIARRKLDDYVTKLRGETKHHEPREAPSLGDESYA